MHRHVFLIGVALGGPAFACSAESALETGDAGVEKTRAPKPSGLSPDIDAAASPVPCFESTDEVTLPAPSGEFEVEVGAPDDTGTYFIPYDEQCLVPIGGIGQAGLLARFAVRVRGDVPRGSVGVSITNPADLERAAGLNHDADMMRDWSCPGDGYCYTVPVYVEITHLNRLPELEGTVVVLETTVTPEGEAPSVGVAWGVFQRL